MGDETREPYTAEDDLRLAIRFGLRKGLASIRGARRTFTEDEQDRIAAEILAHLKLANYTIVPGRPRGGHSNLMPIYGTRPDPEDAE
jgi:hypothetical protein